MEATLAGRHALVTGASSGIGRASARALAAAGAQVTAVARRGDRLAALVEELEAVRPAGHGYRVVDLEDLAAVAALADEVVARAGAVQILINNTGGPPAGPILAATPADFLRPLSRHLLAAHVLVQKLVPGMRASGYGRIINIVSTSVREPIPGLGVSNTVRGAVASWAKSLSKELDPGITINNILPGYTETERLTELGDTLAASSGRTREAVREGWIGVIPERRLGRPEELAAAVAFLASPAAAYIRGVSLPVDGGRLSSI